MSESETENDRIGRARSKADGTDRVLSALWPRAGLVGKYDINLCRQCFREIARDMGFRKYR